MIVWIDAQLSPQLANWLSDTFKIQAVPVRDLGYSDAEDEEVFESARDRGAIIMTKDRDFAELVARLGPPPQILWITRAIPRTPACEISCAQRSRRHAISYAPESRSSRSPHCRRRGRARVTDGSS